MEAKTYTTIDRAALWWPAGPWDSEPDKVQWPDTATGIPCLAVRHPRSGHWCGYVGVADGHPMYGKDYVDVDLSVHWGLTFSAPCSPGDDETRGICHVPGPGEPDHVWWLGFDCAHCDDYSPSDKKNEAERGYPFTIMAHQQYRTLAYVGQQCAELAAQVAQAAVCDAQR